MFVDAYMMVVVLWFLGFGTDAGRQAEAKDLMPRACGGARRQASDSRPSTSGGRPARRYRFDGSSQNALLIFGALGSWHPSLLMADPHPHQHSSISRLRRRSSGDEGRIIVVVALGAPAAAAGGVVGVVVGAGAGGGGRDETGVRLRWY